MKMAKYLEESGLLIKSVSQTVENKAKKNKKVNFYLRTLRTFSRCYQVNQVLVYKEIMLAGKGVVVMEVVMETGEEIIKDGEGQDF